MDHPNTFSFHPVASSISSLTADDICGELIRFLQSAGGDRISSEEIDRPVPLLFLVVTGGTEQAILHLWKKRNALFPKEPILLLAHPNNNSLPASLEVLARIQQEQGRGRIIFVDPAHPGDLERELKSWIRFHQTRNHLAAAKIGLLGAASDWLVASTPDHATIRTVWGPEVLTYDIEEVVERPLRSREAKAKVHPGQFVKNAAMVKEASEVELNDVGVIHEILQRFVRSNNLAAISIRCFDLVVRQKSTACYALSRLNDEGIIAGCEGDLVSTIGMLWAHELTGEVVWMSNPAQIDEKNNSVLLAHCTVPLTMVDRYSIRSHFESGLGVGIQGKFSEDIVTLFRIGGKNLDALWVAEGEMEATEPTEHLCRTQVRIRLQDAGTASSLLREPLGNHLLLVRGAYARELRMFWEMFIKKS